MAGIRSMNVLYYLAVALWLGGMVALGAIVAPALFSTTHTLAVQAPAFAGMAQPDRQVAGEIFAHVLHAFTCLTWACLAAMVLAELLEMWVFRPTDAAWRWVRKVLLAALVIAVWYDARTLRPAMSDELLAWRTAATQPAPVLPGSLTPAPAQPATAPSAEEHRAKFAALHATSVRLWTGETAALFLILLAMGWSQASPKAGAKTARRD